MRKCLALAAAVAGALLCQPAHADLPVIDFAQLAQWFYQLQAMASQYEMLQHQYKAMTNVPPNLKTMVGALLEADIRTPLGDIRLNLDNMQRGGTPGVCAQAVRYAQQNQYQPANGNDFMAVTLNASANRSGGMFACNQQMMTATQNRLNAMPALLDALQAAQDFTQVEAIKARIDQENATTTAQILQAQTMAQDAETQRWLAKQQIYQKQRADSEEVINATASTAMAPPAAFQPPPGFQPPPPFQPDAAPFSAANYGG
jgi:ribosomal protein S24E